MDEFEKECIMLRQMGLKTSELRLEYEKKVEELKFLPEILKKEGKSKEQAAKIMYTKRRELGRIYKEAAPPLFREYIYAATKAKYGDPLGPGFETLKARKSFEQIIESSSRPIENLDDRLTIEGFRKWYENGKRL